MGVFVIVAQTVRNAINTVDATWRVAHLSSKASPHFEGDDCHALVSRSRGLDDPSHLYPLVVRGYVRIRRGALISRR